MYGDQSKEIKYIFLLIGNTKHVTEPNKRFPWAMKIVQLSSDNLFPIIWGQQKIAPNIMFHIIKQEK